MFPVPVSLYDNNIRARFVTPIQGSDFISVLIRKTDVPLTKDVDPHNDSGRLSEEIKFVKFSAIAWTPDSKGFFYQVRVAYFHYLGFED